MSTWGNYFRVTTYGESHCAAVGCIVDGCPPGLPLTADDIQPQLSRRRPGQSALTTPRNEKDRAEVLSGTEFGRTLGTPISVMVRNEDQRPHDYVGDTMDAFPRPGHADLTYLQKYGIKASSGGGRSSARETIGRVAAGAIAEKYLRLAHQVEIVAFVSSVGHEALLPETPEFPHRGANPAFTQLLHTITRATVDQFEPVRCPDGPAADRMQRIIETVRDQQDSIGGTVTCVVRNVPQGLGEPAFDKLEATLAHAMLSIPATKGFEIGSGFGGCTMRGSEHNDPYEVVTGDNDDSGSESMLVPKTNHAGGVQGGISNGRDIYFTVAFKPPATIGKPQATASYGLAEGVLAAKGRHDPCVVPRAIPIVEAMTALVVMDSLMAQYARDATRRQLAGLELE